MGGHSVAIWRSILLLQAEHVGVGRVLRVSVTVRGIWSQGRILVDRWDVL